MRVRILPVGALAGFACMAVASAASAAQYGVDITHYIGDDGRGMLIANPTGGEGTISWALCVPAGSNCQPFVGVPGSESISKDRILHVGNAPPGSIFRAIASLGNITISTPSRVYLGQVSATSSPNVDGRVKAGRYVRTVPASWLGGWGHDSSLLQLQVCKTSTSARCRVIADSFYWDRCDDGAAAVIPARFKGRYLRVVDERITLETPFPLFAVTHPWDLKALRTSPRTVAATYGPIAATRGLPRRSDSSYARRCHSLNASR